MQPLTPHPDDERPAQVRHDNPGVPNVELPRRSYNQGIPWLRRDVSPHSPDIGRGHTRLEALCCLYTM